MAQKLRITYDNGIVEDVVATPKAQVMAERFLRQQGGLNSSTIIEGTIRLAYEASKPGIGNVGYEEWLDKVADASAVCPDCNEAMEDPDVHVCPTPAEGGGSEDPTPEGQSLTPSSD